MPSLRVRIAAIVACSILTVAVAAGQQASRAEPLPAADLGFPATGHGQEPAPTAILDREVRLNLAEVELSAAVQEIARRAGLRISYSADVIPDGSRISIRSERITVREALNAALDGTGLEVTVSPGGVLIIAPGRPRDSERGREGSIRGRVTDRATGVGLPGAAVRLEHSRRSALTGTDGRFILHQVAAGTHLVTATRIGYSPESLTLSVGAGDTASANFALTASAIPLDQIVVTGTIIPTSARAVPTPVTVISGEELRSRNFQSVDEIFRGRVAGATSPDWGAGHYASTVHVRGTSTVASGISNIKTYVNGIEATDNNFLSTIDPNSIERIEVIRGPQAATLYGPEAINGVMQIFTRKGTASEQPELRMKVALGAIQSPYVSGTTPVQDHALSLTGGGEEFSYHLGGSYRYTGEWQPEFSSRTPALNAGTRMRQGPVTVELATRFGRTIMDAPWDPLVRDLGYPIAAVPPNDRISIQQQTHGVTVSYQAHPAWDHHVTIGQDVFEFDTHRTAPRLSTPADTLLQVNTNRTGRLSARYSTSIIARANSTLSATVTAGGDYYRLHGSSFLHANTLRTRGALTGTTISAARTSSVNSGLFSQVVLGFADALHLTAGVRGDWNDNLGAETGAAVSPRFGATYTADFGDWTVKSRAAYGEAIRPPQVGARDGVRSAAALVLPNPAIAAERQRGWEAGIDVGIGSHGWLGVTRYDQEAVDLIETVLIDAAAQPMTFQAQNVGRISNRGWEIEGGAVMGDLRVTGTYSITNSTIKQLSPTYTGAQQIGEQLSGVPVRSAGLDLSYRVRSGTELTAALTHRGSWRELDFLAYYGWLFGGDEFRGSLAEYLIDYRPVTKLNLSASQQITPRINAFVRVDNVTHNLDSEIRNVLAATGRTAMVGVWVTH